MFLAKTIQIAGFLKRIAYYSHIDHSRDLGRDNMNWLRAKLDITQQQQQDARTKDNNRV